MNYLRRHISKRVYWEGAPRRRAVKSKRIQGNCFATWLAVLGFMVMELVSGLSLANPSDSESFLVVHALFSQDECQQEGFCEVVRHMVSILNLS